MASKPDFAAMTDDRLNEHLARLDGWTNIDSTAIEYGWTEFVTGTSPDGKKNHEIVPNYTTSLDAAVALAERWGYRVLGVGEFAGKWCARVGVWSNKNTEADTPARALSEALATAKAREESK